MSVALGMQHAMRMRYIVICGLPQALQMFSTLSQKKRGGGGTIFEKKFIARKMYVLISPTISVSNISHSKKK